MLINRNNYENYFLLYADNELSNSERILVENFVAVNEDLRIELEMLEATKLTPDEILLTDKSFLYKEIVFENDIQEKLLLKLDNELPANQLSTFNNLIQNNTTLKNEYELLEKTKLDVSEKIIFEHKHLLYKKENDNVVVFFRWAAAAIVIGIALFTGYNYLKPNKISGNDLVNIDKPLQQVTTTANDSIIAPLNTNDNNSLQSNNTESTVLNNKTNTENISKKINNNIVTFSDDNRINNTTNKKSINEIDTALKNQFIAQQTLIVPNNNIAELKPKDILIAENTKSNKDIAKEMLQLEDTYASAVAYNEIEKSENKILYINEDAIKKSKAGGFFRKVKTFVTKTANIKPGNSLKIAGFEIAAN